MDPMPPTPEPPPPEPTPAPTPAPAPTEPAPVQTSNAEAEVDRPAQLSIALGIGYTTPVSSLESPNIASARLRLPTGLTFEPQVQLSSSSHSEDDSVTETTDKATVFGVGGLVRLPLITHGKVDLEGLGSLRFATSKVNPEGDYNNTTTTTFQIGYGLAVSYWISHHWNFSMSITNPIIDYTTSKQGLGVSGSSQKTTDTTLGIIFDTDVFFMLHLYN
jgi:hypothetical protein